MGYFGISWPIIFGYLAFQLGALSCGVEAQGAAIPYTFVPLFGSLYRAVLKPDLSGFPLCLNTALPKGSSTQIEGMYPKPT